MPTVLSTREVRVRSTLALGKDEHSIMEELLKQRTHYPYQAGGPVAVVEDCVKSVSSLCVRLRVVWGQSSS